MSRIRVKSEQVIDAPPEAVYAVISDYRNSHPQILTSNFLDYRVEEGGTGSGTVVSFRLRAAGRERPYRMQIKELEKGQVLTENDLNSSLVTMWTLTPLNNGQQTRVRLTTQWEGSGGVGGFFERTFAPLGMRSIYGKILSSLNQVAQPTERKSVVQKTGPNNVLANLGLIVLTIGGIIAVAFGLSFLRRAQIG